MNGSRPPAGEPMTRFTHYDIFMPANADLLEIQG